MMSYVPKRRDIAVEKVCNWIINNVASREYRALIYAIYHLGRKDLDDVVKLEWIPKEKP